MTHFRSILHLFILTLGLFLGAHAAVSTAHAGVLDEGGMVGGGGDAGGECSMEDYYNSLGGSENGGAYGGADCNGEPGSGCACNTIGCCGKYQFCPSTLAGLGYNRTEFINSPEQQEEAIRRFTENNYNYLVEHGAADYIGTTVNGVEVTWSGLLGAAHLGGAAGAMKLLTSGGAYNPNDNPNNPDQGTYLSEYMDKFKGFDTEGGAGSGDCDMSIDSPPGGFQTEQICDNVIKDQLKDALNEHKEFRANVMRNRITPPVSRDQIANEPCVSQELNNISSQFSDVGGILNISGSGGAGDILNNFFKSGFESLNEAASSMPAMLDFQSQASSVLGNLLSSLGVGGAFNNELCGMMADMVLKFIQCAVPMELPSFDLTIGGDFDINSLLPDNCAGELARDALFGAANSTQNEGMSQPLDFVNGLFSAGQK
ncbi:MAG TPA: hypothetical protein VIN59_01090 [Alphaproteobacteria bacterium]